MSAFLYCGLNQVVPEFISYIGLNDICCKYVLNTENGQVNYSAIKRLFQTTFRPE